MKILIFKLGLVSFILTNINIYAQERYNYAEVWKGLDDYTRYVYLWGFVDGVSETYVTASLNWLRNEELYTNPELPKVKKVRERMFLVFDLEVVRDVITGLYKEPANSFISFSSMALLARDKLRGDDIEDLLREERKAANETYLLNKKLNK
jgi:hypothetical protein